jgi:hypothetical protein
LPRNATGTPILANERRLLTEVAVHGPDVAGGGRARTDDTGRTAATTAVRQVTGLGLPTGTGQGEGDEEAGHGDQADEQMD